MSSSNDQGQYLNNTYHFLDYTLYMIRLLDRININSKNDDLNSRKEISCIISYVVCFKKNLVENWRLIPR